MNALLRILTGNNDPLAMGVFETVDSTPVVGYGVQNLASDHNYREEAMNAINNMPRIAAVAFNPEDLPTLQSGQITIPLTAETLVVDLFLNPGSPITNAGELLNLISKIQSE